MKATTPRKAERGFSLIELMIAVVIGLVLTVTVAQLFVGSRQTYATTDDVSRMQENIRYTYQVLTRAIHLAGYKSSPNPIADAAFTPAEPLLESVDGGAGAGTDSFTLRFEGSSNGPGQPADGTVLDCFGLPIAAGVKAVNVFTIGKGVNGRNALFCDNNPTDAEPARELVADVQNMQVLYGLDSDTLDTNYIANTYVIGGPGLAVNDVRSMRVALLFETPNLRAAVTPETQIHTLNGVALPAFNDTYIRRVVTMTVNLRNRTP